MALLDFTAHGRTAGGDTMAVNIGEKYGKWLVIGEGTDSKHRRCKCDCGEIKEVRVDHLADGRSRSCGCSKKENHPWIYKGNPWRGRLNRIYGNMLRRCYDEKSDNYSRYGGRGITVCEAWRNSFDAFADWAYSNGYSKDLSIDRIDNSKGYSPENCRWVTMQEQQNNKTTNIFFEIDGERKTAKQTALIAGVKPSKIYQMLRRGVTKQEVLSRIGLV